jgi:hypothetical protein
MRVFSLLFLLIPVLASAQLDRLRTDMAEQDFIKQFPDAIRNLDEEAYWTGGADTLNGIEGSSLWHLYNDTVDVYRFLSVKVEGPSKAYPKFDSTAVHKMKLCLDKVKADLEKEFGMPGTFRNTSLQNIGNPGVNRAYSVVWTFPGNNDYIQLSISTDLSAGNYINAPGKLTVVESQSYEMRIEVTHRDDYTMLWHDIGKSSERFFTIYKNFRAPLIRDRIYTMKDSTVSSNAGWIVKFTSGQLVSFQYSATTGKAYRAKSDAEAYLKLKTKADQLLKESETGYGKSDSLSNLMPSKYKPHDRQLVYHVDHLYARWKTAEGKMEISLEETGGGKNPDVIFVLRVDFN